MTLMCLRIKAEILFLIFSPLCVLALAAILSRLSTIVHIKQR